MLQFKNPHQRLEEFKKECPNLNNIINKEYIKIDRKELPSYCFLPISSWVKMAKNFINFKEDDNKNYEMCQKYIMFYYKLSVYGTWSVSKIIYKINEDFLKELISTEISNNIPSDVFKKIPFPCIYIETPGLSLIKYKMNGFWMITEFSPDNSETSSSVSIFLNGDEQCDYLPLCSLTSEKISIYIEDSDISIILNKIIPICLYICSENNRINEDSSSPLTYGTHNKKKDKFRLIEPSKAKVRIIGEKEGALIRDYHNRVYSERDSSPSKMSPHIRRAHWHGYWCGKNRSEFKYNWVSPSFINFTESRQE
jgi:hypothetical protein